MKSYIYLVICCCCLLSIDVLAQNKKEQIISLSNKVDSLESLIQTENNLNQKLLSEKTDIILQIGKLNDSIFLSNTTKRDLISMLDSLDNLKRLILVEIDSINKRISPSKEIEKSCKSGKILVGGNEIGCIENARSINSNILSEITGAEGGKRFYLVPFNMTDYSNMCFNPMSALSFILFSDEQKIKSLSIYDLQKGGMTARKYDPIIPFSKIKGCEELSKLIPTYDEFTLLEKKDEIISIILSSYNNLSEEYLNIYLRGENGSGSYKFAQTDYTGNIYTEVFKNSYNFEKQQLKINLPFVKNQGDRNIWEYMYTHSKFSNPHQKSSTTYIYVPLDYAKLLFENDIRIFSETIYTVKPKYGYHGGDSYRYGFFTDFDILYMIINYYGIDKWDEKNKTFQGDPILSIKINSSQNIQLK